MVQTQLTVEQALQQAAQALDAGRMDLTAQLCQAVLEAQPEQAAALHLMGLVAHRTGRVQDAVGLLLESVQREPTHAAWYYNLAISLHALGMSDETIDACQMATRVDPNYAPAWHLLGSVYVENHRLEEGIPALCKALTLNPRRAEWWAHLGAARLKQGDAEQAKEAYEQAVELAPEVPAHRMGLGQTLLALTRPREARQALEKAIELSPDNAVALLLLGIARREQGNTDAAEQLLRRAIDLDPQRVETLRTLAALLRDTDRLAEAEILVQQALASHPEDAELIAVQASLLNRSGDTKAAFTLLEPVVQSDALSTQALIEFAFASEALGAEQEAATCITRALEQGKLNPSQRSLLGFAQGRLLDRLHQHDPAFDAVDQANRLRNIRLDRVRCTAEFEQLQQITSEWIAAHQLDADAGRGMIFIVGMPRSGTTLIDRILSTHPQVTSVGESPLLPKLAYTLGQLGEPAGHYSQTLAQLDAAVVREQVQQTLQQYRADARSDAPYIVDKLPGNFVDVGLIATLLPQAQIIHARRDARHTCLSCYFQHFSGVHNYAYDLSDLGFYWTQYQQLMAHWNAMLPGKLIPVDYEALVADLEPIAKGLLHELDLPWDEGCLTFHQQSGRVLTASFSQVVQPIYSSSVGKWQRYAHRLKPLLEALPPQSDSISAGAA